MMDSMEKDSFGLLVAGAGDGDGDEDDVQSGGDCSIRPPKLRWANSRGDRISGFSGKKAAAAGVT